MTAREYLASSTPVNTGRGSAGKFLSLHLYYDPYSATAADDYEQLREQLKEFDVLALLREELSKGRVDATLTKRLVAALKFMADVPKEQAIRSLLENIETLAPVLPHVLRAIRENVSDLPDAAQEQVHASIRELIETSHHVAKVEVNLAYMVRILSERKCRENEDLLVNLFNGPHGYSFAPAPNIQRDIILTLARWKATWWLHDRKAHFGTMHAWARRAFFIGSYALGDEGAHWRPTVRPALDEFDDIVAKWIADRYPQSGWSIPL